MEDIGRIEVAIWHEKEVITTDLEYPVDDELFIIAQTLGDEDITMPSTCEILGAISKPRCSSIKTSGRCL
jgi:hypothetical protein